MAFGDDRRGAWAKARRLRKFPCSKCGLYGCTCQISLDEWTDAKAVWLKSRCPKCLFYLCDCPRDAKGNRIL